LWKKDFSLPEVPYLFQCTTTELVTVPAGPYLAYNITSYNGLITLYYAPEAGTIIKIRGSIGDDSLTLGVFDVELLDTNYERSTA
jgi:hypothetical protein